MPSACMPSLTRTSRSIGPTAALPSPPRAKGVRPEPLKAMSRRRPGTVDHLADQQRTAVTELRRESTELVARVGLSQRFCAFGQCVPGEQSGLRRVVERGEIEAQLLHQRIIEKQQPRRRSGRRLPRNVEPLKLARERVVEPERGDRVRRCECRGHETSLPHSTWRGGPNHPPGIRVEGKDMKRDRRRTPRA